LDRCHALRIKIDSKKLQIKDMQNSFFPFFSFSFFRFDK